MTSKPKTNSRRTKSPPPGHGVMVAPFRKGWLVLNEDGEIVDTTQYLTQGDAVKAGWARIDNFIEKGQNGH